MYKIEYNHGARHYKYTVYHKRRTILGIITVWEQVESFVSLSQAEDFIKEALVAGQNFPKYYN